MSTEGALAVWNKYRELADPIVILQDGDWVEVTLDDLVKLVVAALVLAGQEGKP